MSAYRLQTAVMFGIMAGALIPGTVRASGAQSKPASVSGSEVFRLYCASCHGTSAKGDGPLAGSMKNRPADLTQIAKRNGGTFAATQVARTIDGRSPVKGHGGGEMPVWGDAFAKSGDSAQVEQKIQSLVSFLESIQVKP